MDDDDLPVEEYYQPPEDAGHTGPAPEIGAVVVNWRDIDGQDAQAARADLAGWVAWLVRRYSITSQAIPDCWWQHGDTVEELSALHTAWTVAYDETDGGYGPIGFQERLAAALTRRALRSRCPAGHRPDPDRIPPEPGW